MRLPNQLRILGTPPETPFQTVQTERPDHEPVLQKRRGGLFRRTQGGVDRHCRSLLRLSFLLQFIIWVFVFFNVGFFIAK
jgi:hypothetical protein